MIFVGVISVRVCICGFWYRVFSTVNLTAAGCWQTLAGYPCTWLAGLRLSALKCMAAVHGRRVLWSHVAFGVSCTVGDSAYFRISSRRGKEGYSRMLCEDVAYAGE